MAPPGGPRKSNYPTRITDRKFRRSPPQCKPDLPPGLYRVVEVTVLPAALPLFPSVLSLRYFPPPSSTGPETELSDGYAEMRKST